MSRVVIFAAIAVSAAIAAACQSPAAQAPPEPETPARATNGPVVVAGPASGDIATYVAAAVTRDAAEGYRSLVYVGAVWCEPCKYFKDAVESGALRQQFGDLRIHEFDSDRDDARLNAAGYGSMMIPLFVVPGPDGRGTDVRMAGGTKGPDAVELLVPRLQALLAEAGSD